MGSVSRPIYARSAYSTMVVGQCTLWIGSTVAHGSLKCGTRMRDVTAPPASSLSSKLAEFPTTDARAFHLSSCLVPSFIDFGQRRDE
jgi:hypothetical protein